MNPRAGWSRPTSLAVRPLRPDLGTAPCVRLLRAIVPALPTTVGVLTSSTRLKAGGFLGCRLGDDERKSALLSRRGSSSQVGALDRNRTGYDLIHIQVPHHSASSAMVTGSVGRSTVPSVRTRAIMCPTLRSRESRWKESNLRPDDYESPALPLSHTAVVVTGGLEPPTSSVSGKRASQLRHATEPNIAWTQEDLNLRPPRYQRGALTICAMGPCAPR